MNSSNFDFLRPVAPGLVEIAAQAEQYVHTDPAGSVVKARNFVEQAVLGIYQGLRLERLGRADLFELLSGAEFQRIVPRQVLLKLHAIRKHGNVGAHEGNISARVSLMVLEELFDVARWLYVSHLRGRIEDVPSYRRPPPTPEDSKGQLKREKREALQRFAAQEARFQQILNELAAARDAQSVAEAEAERLRQELTSRGAAAVDELHFDEKTTRRRLIDSMLIEAGWNVGPDGANTDEISQEERVAHQPTETGGGHVDYVLWDDDGKPLALVEAKRTSIDAKDGQIQARHYAEGLERTYGRRPVILCTNGFDIWIWDDAQGYPPRTIFGFYSKDSLQQLVFQRSHAQPLAALSPDPGTVDRLYQTNAIKSVTERFTGKRRKALLVQATGTGKTRVAIALADLMMRANWVKRVLFLCDRRELRKQARDAFLAHTPHTPVIVRASTSRERHHRVYLATYPAMTQIFRSFDPGFFDLIIADESHRSIYNVYGDLFRWFDGFQLGLTATPVEMISKSTCNLFGCDRNDPTFNYPYEEAVEERYLVPFELYTHTTKFLREGIRGTALSDEQLAELEEQGVDPNTLDFDAAEIDREIFNRDTNRRVLQNLMDQGLRGADGQTLGKSIIFARSHRHATLLRDLFDELYPQYGGAFCHVIDHYEPRAETLIDEFKDPKNELTIALSVDMLDTGIDVPEVVNLVFAKPVKSKVKFWQMIGRGTRLCLDLLGSGRHKSVFRIFDHWGNFEYFGTRYREADDKIGKGLMQLVFESRIELAEAALRKADLDTLKRTAELIRADIERLPEDSIRVRERWREVREAKDPARLDRFDPGTLALLRNDIAPLMQWINIRGESPAHELDKLIAEMQRDLVVGSSAFEDRQADLMNRVQALPMHLNQVREKAELIREMGQPAFWDRANITTVRLETVRTELRHLMRHVPVAGGGAPQPRVIDVTDTGERFQQQRSRIASIDLATYRQRVKEVLDRIFERDPTLAKIRKGEPVSEADLNRLTALVLTQNPDVDLAVLKDFYVVAEPLEKIIRSIVGRDAEEVDRRFRAFTDANPELTAKQTNFLRLLKTHIARHGSIDVDDLYEAPFTSIDRGGPDGVFADNAQIEALLRIVEAFEKAPEPKAPAATGQDEP